MFLSQTLNRSETVINEPWAEIRSIRFGLVLYTCTDTYNRGRLPRQSGNVTRSRMCGGCPLFIWEESLESGLWSKMSCSGDGIYIWFCPEYGVVNMNRLSKGPPAQTKIGHHSDQSVSVIWSVLRSEHTNNHSHEILDHHNQSAKLAMSRCQNAIISVDILCRTPYSVVLK